MLEQQLGVMDHSHGVVVKGVPIVVFDVSAERIGGNQPREDVSRVENFCLVQMPGYLSCLSGFMPQLA